MRIRQPHMVESNPRWPPYHPVRLTTHDLAIYSMHTNTKKNIQMHKRNTGNTNSNAITSHSFATKYVHIVLFIYDLW